VSDTDGAVESRSVSAAHFLFRRALPLAAVIFVMSVVCFLLLFWGAREVDRVTNAREIALFSHIADDFRLDIAREQETVTFWDDAVTALRGEKDLTWIDANLGSWMLTFFGQSEIYILDPDHVPIYAFSDGRMQTPDRYAPVATLAQPLIDSVEAQLRGEKAVPLPPRMQSPGAADVVLIKGRPAVISVKPVVSASGALDQKSGEFFLHIALRYLDGDFLQGIAERNLLSDLRFELVVPDLSGVVSYPLIDNSGHQVGAFVWRAFQPGIEIRRYMVAGVAILLLAVLGAVVAVMVLLWRKTLGEAEAESRAQHVALFDSLTDLPNRQTLNRKIDAVLAGPRGFTGYGLIYLDLDRFKQVNDSLGHPVGDEILKICVARMRSVVDARETIARVGGDEFIILAGGRSETEVASLAGALVDALRAPFNIAGDVIFVGASAGYVCADTEPLDRDEMVRRASVALYYAKSAGRNRAVRFIADMGQWIEGRKKTGLNLRYALSVEENIKVFYQPVIALDTRQVQGFEALMRWRHPIEGWIAPDFIAAAEETGLIRDLGRRVLAEACRAARAWPGKTIAVNASARELADPTYGASVAEMLKAAGVAPQQLELEVTETVVIEQGGSCGDNLRQLRALGVKIAIDDFGTGFSSFSRLQQLPVDRVKLDKSFIDDLETSETSRAIVEAMIQMARAAGLATTAEGVERHTQNAWLTSVGCACGQGFYYAPPLPMEEINGLTAGIWADPPTA